VAKARSLGGEVEQALRAPTYREFLANLYGSEPDQWRDDLTGWGRLRVVVNAMTRMRFCTREGKMEFRAKGRDAPAGYLPWYETRTREPGLLVCGHWSALGLKLAPPVALLDSGCVWGGALTALRLEDRRVFQVPCGGYQAAGGE
jgi:bis(5'-nucleosyl)-tetraphosphatase (symmetrical)